MKVVWLVHRKFQILILPHTHLYPIPKQTMYRSKELSKQDKENHVIWFNKLCTCTSQWLSGDQTRLGVLYLGFNSLYLVYQLYPSTVLVELSLSRRDSLVNIRSRVNDDNYRNAPLIWAKTAVLSNISDSSEQLTDACDCSSCGPPLCSVYAA